MQEFRGYAAPVAEVINFETVLAMSLDEGIALTAGHSGGSGN